MKKRRIYLDNASTTPLDKEVLKAILPYLKEEYGNPGTLYELGRRARQAVSKATEQVAKFLNCRMNEIVFTGGATEADNLAIAGTARANKVKGNRIIVSSVEHKGILAVCDALEKEGFEIVKLPVGRDGAVSLADFKKALDDKTILVSVTMADSETGTLQPIAEIFELLKNFRHAHATELPYFHTDASQAAPYRDVNVEKLGVDLLTLSAHKMHGPKGIGGLYIRRGVTIQPIIYGGGQQGKLRSGTENVPGIVGFGAAAAKIGKNKKAAATKLAKLRDQLEQGILKSIPKVIINGNPKKRLPNFSNISILDVEGEALLLYLDELGIMVNTGSACNSESLEPSYVLAALGNPYEFVHGSIRFSLGSDTAKEDVSYVLEQLPEVVSRLRAISPLNLSLNQKEKMSEPKAFVGNQTPHFLRKKKHA